MSLLDRIKKIVQKYEDIQVPTYTLVDGTVVSIDKLEVGGKVLLTDGTVPTAGEWTLDDGTVITTDETGLILTLVAPTAMETATLLDGTVISVSTLDVGGSVLIDGAPAKEGTYTLSGNTVITVDAEGKITAVTPPVAEEQVDFAAQFDALKTEFQNSLQSLVEQAVTTALTSTKQNYAKVENENTELKGIFKEVLEIVQELAKEPAAEIPGKKTRMSLQDPNRKLNQLDKLSASLLKIKEEHKN